MISYVKGKLECIAEDSIIVEAGGIGYRIFVSGTTATQLKEIGSLVKIYTYMSVKDDGMTLFGFKTIEEQDIFNKLITVTGVGPKGALGFLACLTPSEIILAIVSDDVLTLTKAPGIGKKTAQRVILELRDKFKNEDLVGTAFGEISTGTCVISNEPKYETIEALIALGYSRSESAKAVAEVYCEGVETEELLKLALKKMMRF